MIVGFYARVSTEEQRERQTIDGQIDYARKRAEAEGWTLRIFTDDGVSGTVPFATRPGGASLLKAARAKELDLVATYRVDRLGRKLRVVLEAMDALGVPYRSLTEAFETGTPLGRATLGLLGVFAELERDTFIERSRAGSDRVAKQRGRWLGGIVPFGYAKRDDLTLAPDETPNGGLSPADIVRDVFRLCAVEGWSTKRIAVDLNARHVPTVYVRDARESLSGDIHGTRARSGKRKKATAGTWSPGAVRRILHNETYAGRHTYGRRSPNAARELISRDMPAIVSPALFQKAKLQMTANFQWDRAHPRRDYPLRGLLTCDCGHALLGTAYKTKGGDIRQYRCSAHPKDSRPVRVFADEAERAIWRDVQAFFADPDATVRAIARGRTNAAEAEGLAEHELVRLANDLDAVHAQIVRCQDDHAAGIFRPDEIAAKVRALRERERGLRSRMEAVREARGQAARAAGETEQTRGLLRTLGQRAKSADAATRAEIMRALVKGSHAAWDGAAVRLKVRYAFAAAEPLAALVGINRDSWRRRA
ncbi:MAG: recombinase family protein [Chloroflexota bacterium]